MVLILNQKKDIGKPAENLAEQTVWLELCDWYLFRAQPCLWRRMDDHGEAYKSGGQILHCWPKSIKDIIIKDSKYKTTAIYQSTAQTPSQISDSWTQQPGGWCC